MKAEFKDILALTDRKPIWYDEKGVPRYSEFSPNDVNDPYANEVALLRIECQDCGQQFLAAIVYDRVDQNQGPKHRLVGNTAVSYGDPPWHNYPSDCECTGNMMTSFTKEILEVWELNPDPRSPAEKYRRADTACQEK
jgi:hypothetical protein